MQNRSQSTLTTLVPYPIKEPGAVCAVSKLQLTGIERFFPDLVFPANAITMLYGNRNAAVPYIGMLEQEPGIGCMLVSVKVDIGRWARQKIGLDDGEFGVANTRMLNLSSCKRDIVDLAVSVAQQATNGASASDGWPKGGTGLPFLAGLLHSQPEFEHLDVICYTVKHHQAGAFQVATVFNTQAIDLDSVIGGGHMGVSFHL